MKIEPELIERLERASKEDGRSVDEIVNTLLADYLDRHDCKFGHPVRLRMGRRSRIAFSPHDWLCEVMGDMWSENEYYDRAECITEHFDQSPAYVTMAEAHRILYDGADSGWTKQNSKELIHGMCAVGFLHREGNKVGPGAVPGMRYVRYSIRSNMVDTVNPFNVPK